MNATPTDFISFLHADVLELKHACKTAQVSYSVADVAGNVLLKGTYNCSGKNEISIAKLPRGFFTVCIVDGDSMVKSHFQKDQ